MLDNRTYRLDKSVPQDISDVDYVQYVREQWDALLRQPAVPERSVQEFMEEHLSVMPPLGLPFCHGNEHVFSRSVITQPRLPGLRSKVPDFMYFQGNSGEIVAVLVEIESPDKRWFTRDGTPHADLTQASNQLAEWKAWFADHANVAVFERDYGVRQYRALNGRQFSQRYILVMGRREQASEEGNIQRRRAMQRENETWMTYDRLQPSHHFLQSPTIELDRSVPGVRFAAKHVPPTLRLGPEQYPDLHNIRGIGDAIQRNQLMSEERKRFLIGRLGYWKQWYESPGNKARLVSDFEGE